DIMFQQPVKLGVEFWIILCLRIGLLEIEQERHQGLSHIAATEGAKVTVRVGAKAKAVGTRLAHAPDVVSVYGALRALLIKAAIFSALFLPASSSTPDDASTKAGFAISMARATFSGVSPPAKPQGRAKLAPDINFQSKAVPRPPGRVA